MRLVACLLLFLSAILMNNTAHAIKCYTGVGGDMQEVPCGDGSGGTIIPIRTGGGSGGGSGGGGSSGSISPYYVPPSPQMQTHAENCAESYGQPHADGFRTDYSSNWGWGKKINGVPQAPVTSLTGYPPSGYTLNDALYGSTDYSGHVSTIYEPSYVSTAQLVASIAHEWSHQNNPNETEADAIAAGEAAKSAYLNDPKGVGSKCGGP